MNLESPRHALLLDLDGTIADTLPHIFDTFRHAVAPWVDRHVTDDEIEATFGPPERDCIGSMIPDGDLDEAVVRFFDYYEAHHVTGVRLFDGIADLVDRAKALGWHVGIFTGKGRRTAEFSLRELGLWDHMDLLVSNDDVSKGKPDPEGIVQAAERFGVPTSRILMVGDMPADVVAGRAVGSKTAAVTWAAFRPEALKAAGPDYLCETVADLRQVVEALHDAG